MNKGKKWIIISSVSMLILSALTIFFVVLKHGESDMRKLYQGYYDLGLWLIVIWQIVIVVICIFLWARVFRNVPGSALYIGRTMSLVLACIAIIFLAGRWLYLVFDHDYGKIVKEQDGYMLFRETDSDGETSYSIWHSDGAFYRRFAGNVGYAADSVAEGVFYTYVNDFKANPGVSAKISDYDENSKEKKAEYELLNRYIRFAEDSFLKSQRGLSWEEKECADNLIGTVQVPIISENGMQDMSWFCDDICEWMEECLEEIPYDDAPWLYKEIVVAVPAVSKSFDLSQYVSAGYTKATLYEGLYDFIDKELTTAKYPEKNNKSYGMLEIIEGDGNDDYIAGIEPDCSYTTKDGIVYGMVPVDRAAGSSYYSLYAYKSGKPSLVNIDPFGGSGGEASWITFIDDTNLGFACLTYNGGDDALLFRTEDGGKSFIQVNYPSGKVKLSDDSIYNPFTIPEKIWSEDGDLYMLVGQSPYSGDYYSEELEKHPSGLYVSHDDGMSFEFVGEQ